MKVCAGAELVCPEGVDSSERATVNEDCVADGETRDKELPVTVAAMVSVRVDVRLFELEAVVPAADTAVNGTR